MNRWKLNKSSLHSSIQVLIDTFIEEAVYNATTPLADQINDDFKQIQYLKGKLENLQRELDELEQEKNTRNSQE